jgi:uncharacterized protein (DUF2147 family)
MQLLIPAALLVVAVQDLSPPATPIGHWINPKGTVIVEIAECGEQALCGWVRWASDKAIADARMGGTDSLIGVEIFHHFFAKSDGRWKGKLFVPDLRRTHAAELRLVDDRHLKVSGCAAVRLICKSQLWARTEQLHVN